MSRRLRQSELEERLLRALAEAPCAVRAELMAEVYPERLAELESARQRLVREGRIVWRYRRWHAKSGK